MSPDSIQEMLKIEVDDERDHAVYKANFIPGWIGEGGLRAEPLQDFEPFSWKWCDGRKLLLAAASYIDPEKAERRNIRMANPVEGKRTSLNTIHCSYQMASPKEFARAHRHTMNAGRLILESDGAYTTIDGEKIYMERNDILLTPNWVWHGLGNESETVPAFWIDFLDDPFINKVQAMFFEVREEIESELPIGGDSPYRIRWSDVQDQLDNSEPDPDGFHGRRVTLPNEALPTMSLYVNRLDKGQQTKPYRSTANRLFVGMEGDGEITVEGKSFTWERGDVVAVPSWMFFECATEGGAVFFEFTDEPVLNTFNWYREEKS